MPFTLKHGLFFDQFRCTIETVGDIATVKCSETGEFRVRFPGPLRVVAKASYRIKIEIDDGDVEGSDGGGSGGKKFDIQEVNLPLTVRIESPDGKEFAARQVTLQDLARFRDLQGVTRGLWTYRITGQSRRSPWGRAAASRSRPEPSPSPPRRPSRPKARRRLSARPSLPWVCCGSRSTFIALAGSPSLSALEGL